MPSAGCFSAVRLTVHTAALGGFTGPQLPRPMNLSLNRGHAGGSLLGGERSYRTMAHCLGLVARVQFGIDGTVDDKGQRRGRHG